VWVGLILTAASPAFSAGGPGWSIHSLAMPTNFKTNDTLDSIQSITVDATGGTYELHLSTAASSEVTVPIAYDASDAEVQLALEAITPGGAGNVTVTGGPRSPLSEPIVYTVTYDGGLSGRTASGRLESEENKLTGGNGSVETEEVADGGALDRYILQVVNNSSGPTQAGSPVTITDALPAGVVPVAVTGKLNAGGAGENLLTCETAPAVQCTYAGIVPPGEAIAMVVKVAVVAPGTSTVVNSATVEGGGAEFATVSTGEPATVPNTINGEEPLFGVQDFAVDALGSDGTPDEQAGGHPAALTTSLDFNSILLPESTPAKQTHVTVGENVATTPRAVKSIITYLPLGMLGDPLATERCQENMVESMQCPAASVVGTRLFVFEGNLSSAIQSVYNVVPESGYPAQLGTNSSSYDIELYASVVPTSAGYRLRIAAPSVPQAYTFTGLTLNVFGDPAAHDGGKGSATPFLTNPTDCSAGPENARIEANSWEEPQRWVSAESTVYPQLVGCESLQFSPTIEVMPETTQSDTPSGYQVTVKVPQSPDVFSDMATPELKTAKVTLPAGVSISPSAANGLAGCQETGPEGIDLGSGDVASHELQEGEEIAPDGLPRVAPGHCPPASILGTVEVATPLLPEKLTGHVYLAQPKCGGKGQPQCTEADATSGNLYGLYLEAAGSGVIVKLKGSVAVSATTGQLEATFEKDPQLPFSELIMKLRGGPLAPLANPQTCGIASTESELVPWSSPETPAASPSWSFPITGCDGSMPFNPTFSADTILPEAGGFSPFTMTLHRGDGEQDLSQLSVSTPEGLLGRIAEVPLCGEPQAQEGTCPSASRIGTANVAAGAGADPFWVNGPVYLTGAYGNAPYGLSIVVPTAAGPFNFGDEVVRAAISVNPETGQLTVSSNPLPLHKDGVPFRVQTVNVAIERPHFVFNPTSCGQLHVTATVTGALPSGAPGSTASVSSPFAVAGCGNLPFKPVFTASTAGSGTVKGHGASLKVKLTFPSANGSQSGAGQLNTPGNGDANIAYVKVDLPKALPSRLETLQKACVAKVFEENPAKCPPESIVAHAKAVTPILNTPLEGPAYFVSHGDEAFPSLTVVLQGGGIVIDLVGSTHIDSKTGVTSSTFAHVPDAPIDSFELTLPESRYSALVALGSLCAQKLMMPTHLVAQNGAELKQDTPIEVEGCALAIASHSIRGRNLTLSVAVPAAGEVHVIGRGLSSATKTARGRETLTFKLHQKQAGRLRTRVLLSFTPNTGKERKRQTKSLAVQFKQ
jgi:hypothetical protein